MPSNHDELIPIVPYIILGACGEYALEGSKCSACNTIHLGIRKVCPRCGSRKNIGSLELSRTGKLYNYTIVHRSNPGIPTPFVSAIVDLDDGAVIKGNLIAPLDDIRFDMPVAIAFAKAYSVDAKGRSYLSYHFVKA